MIDTTRKETEIIHMQGNAMLPSSSNLCQSHWDPNSAEVQRERSSNGSSGRRVVANRSVLSNSDLGLLKRSLVVMLGLSVKETERHLLVLVSALGTLSGDTGSSVRDGVAESVVVRDSAVDGVRVFATGEP